MLTGIRKKREKIVLCGMFMRREKRERGKGTSNAENIGRQKKEKENSARKLYKN